jgi:uncharacterized delta-60 repeat protein
MSIFLGDKLVTVGYLGDIPLSEITRATGPKWVYIAGELTLWNGQSVSKLIRTDINGNLDTTFNPTFDNTIISLKVVEGGIYAGGQFTVCNGVSQSRFTKLNEDGTTDTSFNIGNGFDNIVWSIDVDSSDKVVVGGDFDNYSGSAQENLVRLNTNGTKDTSLNIGTGFARTGVGGTTVYKVLVDENDKIYVGGVYDIYSGSSYGRIMRLNSNGSIDTSFPTQQKMSAIVYDIEIDTKDYVWVAGNLTSYDSTTISLVTKLKQDATLDPSFTQKTTASTITYLSLDPNNNCYFVTSGNQTWPGGYATEFHKINESGSWDTNWSGSVPGATNNGRSILWSETGVFVGSTTTGGDTSCSFRGAQFNGVADNNFTGSNQDVYAFQFANF